MDIPENSRYHLGDGPGALTALTAGIRVDAYRVYMEFESATSSSRALGAISDRLSMAMLYFLNEAKKLVDVPGSAGIVFDLIGELGDLSYGDLECDSLARCGDRPSDQIVDNMLQGLALPCYREDPDWDFLGVLEALMRRAEFLEGIGIKDYYVQTIAELTRWKSTPPADSTSAMDVDG